MFDNVTYANGDHGIDVHNAVDARVIANTVYGNYDSGIEMTTSTGSTARQQRQRRQRHQQRADRRATSASTRRR